MKQRKEEIAELSTEERQLCAVMRAVVTGTASPDLISDEDSFKRFFRLCKEQKVLPMAYMCMKNTHSFSALSHEGKKAWHDSFVTAAAVQRLKTAGFLKVTKLFPRDGEWFVAKGIALRELYPVPELRPSGDEDIYVSEKNYTALVSRLEDAGLRVISCDETQTVMHDASSHLTLEIEAADKDSFKELSEMTAGGQMLPTLSPTRHAAFLISHAAEHFCHGGFGIRMLADIAVFMRACRDEIDTEKLVTILKNNKQALFAANMFKLCESTLGAELPEGIAVFVSKYKTDTAPLLKDMMGGGIYGTANEARKLSGRITAMTAEKGSLFRAVFPDTAHMKEGYPVLNNCILLLPFLYVHRLVSYVFRARRSSGIALGMERLVLLKKYGLQHQGNAK